MKVAIIYNEDFSNVINRFGIQNREVYNVKTVNLVAKALESHGHNVEVIDGNMNVIESLQGFMPKVLEGERMGMVFNMAYGIQGESRYTHIPSLLEMIGIPYVGSNPSGHALALDKVTTKIILQKHGIPTPNFWVYSSHEEKMNDVEYPVIVKPKMEAVSFGLKVVDNEGDLREAVRFIIEEYQQQALVEQFIRGREFAIGTLGNNPPEAFPVLEIDLESDPDAIQTMEDKKQRPRQKICPADLPEKLAVDMQNASIEAFKSLHLYDFSRVDIRLDEQGNFYILEVNSMASLGKTGSYTFSAAAAGLEYDALVNKILDSAAIRYFGNEYQPKAPAGRKKQGVASQKVKSFLRNRQKNYFEMLKSLVNTNTHVRNLEGVNHINSVIHKHLNSLGFSFQVIPQAEIGNIQFFSNTDTDEYDILLIGNIDNQVEIGRTRYFKETEQKIFGTGVWENKGGLVIMIAALQALKSIKELPKKKIGILLTSDSSIKNKISASIIKKKAVLADYVLGLKGAFLDGGMVTSRSGAGTYEISLNLIDNSQESNILKASQIYNRLVSSLTGISNEEEGILVTPSLLSFNSNVSNLSANGRINLAVRYNNRDQLKKIEQEVSKLTRKKYARLLDFYISVGNKRPPMQRSEKVEQFWQLAKSTADTLDIRLREEHRWSSSDICFVPDSVFRLDGMGPIGIRDENRQEYILKYSLIERSALLATLIKNLGNS